MAAARLPEFIRYLLAGLLAAAANFGSRFVFSLWWPFEVAVVAAFAVGLVTGFVLMRHFAFRAAEGPLLQQAWRYGLVNALALVQTVLLSSLLARWLLPALGWPWNVQATAHAVGVAVPVFTSYLGHRLGTFRARGAPSAGAAP
jgi:putative flippase GtrA